MTPTAATTSQPTDARRAPPLDQAAGIRQRDFRIRLDSKEQVALGLAVLMTLAPLAMAAWGALAVS